MRHTHHRRFCNSLMGNQGTFDFHRGNVMACHQHDVIYAAQQPNVAILVFARTITCKVQVLVAELRPIHILVAVIIAPKRSQHTWPRRLDHQKTTISIGNGLTIFIDNIDVNSWKWPRCRSWLRSDDSR